MARHEITRAMMLEAAFLNRENRFLHNSYDDEMAPHHYMVNGGKENMLEAMRTHWRSEGTGTLSRDPLQNAKYLFVAIITIACRFCVERGMDPAEAYDASDLYIRRMDACTEAEAIRRLTEDMMCFYCDAMAERRRRASLSLPIVRTLDFIEAQLHDKLDLETLAIHSGVSRTYLSALFHREMGVTLSAYVVKRRVEAARNMLRYTRRSAAEIGEYLAFSNPSHFQRAFKQETGMTPGQYRRAVGSYAMHDAVDKPTAF